MPHLLVSISFLQGREQGLLQKGREGSSELQKENDCLCGEGDVKGSQNSIWG